MSHWKRDHASTTVFITEDVLSVVVLLEQTVADQIQSIHTGTQREVRCILFRIDV